MARVPPCAAYVRPLFLMAVWYSVCGWTHMHGFAWTCLQSPLLPVQEWGAGSDGSSVLNSEDPCTAFHGSCPIAQDPSSAQEPDSSWDRDFDASHPGAVAWCLTVALIPLLSKG